jgi:hypothetical protein
MATDMDSLCHVRTGVQWQKRWLIVSVLTVAIFEGWPSLPGMSAIRPAEAMGSAAASCDRSHYVIGTHRAFDGVQAKMKSGISPLRLNGFMPRNDDKRWCVFGFLIEVQARKVVVFYYYKANAQDEIQSAHYLSSSGLFTHVTIFRSRHWIPPT